MKMAKRYLWGPESPSVLALALAALITDQASKNYLIHSFDIQSNGPVEVSSFFNLVMVWNRGISYGLFQQNADSGRIALTVLTFAVAFALWIWSARTVKKLPSYSLGILIGGAFGNGIDRAVYGAVADFFHFHVGGFSWYVFNLADVWIVAGVVGLLYDAIFDNAKKPAT